jgi:mono/diheme cytochrome c family protein
VQAKHPPQTGQSHTTDSRLNINKLSGSALFRTAFFLLFAAAAFPADQGESSKYSLDRGTQFIKTYCAACHFGKSPAGNFHATDLSPQTSFHDKAQTWSKVIFRVRNSEMPPKGMPAPSADEREQFSNWAQNALHVEACAAGIFPGPAPIRRLSRAQYGATIRDLLNLHVDAGSSLDGAGGEGFDNAAETLFLSPIHAEKYLDAAKLALDSAAKDPRSRARFLIAQPGPGVSKDAAARTILSEFLPRAFRRPLQGGELASYLQVFHAALTRGDSFDEAVLFALRAALMSPQFLFRSEIPNPAPNMRPLDDYALASRLSYFLWGSMPDSLLMALADKGKLKDPEILKVQVARMLRNTKSFDFAQSFVEQWLRTRDLGKSIEPDTGLFPAWKDAELQGDIRYQPILFFREILASDLSVLNLLDSDFTIATRKLQKLYGLNVKQFKNSQPTRIDLPPNSNRGGLLGMSAVLVVSSHPQRTSPVLRGKWLLEAILGTPPPPPPPNVPPLEEGPAVASQTVRERLAQHRANPVCATCHARIDPMGFALENYDVMGKWRTEEAGKPIDAKGQLPDGTSFNGPAELKAVLLERKDVFLRNLTNKLLGYALGRGLTLQDSCTVDAIVAEVKRNNYRAGALINAIVLSTPFRFQAGAVPVSVISQDIRFY